MKIAVTAIAKNEEKFVDRFMDACQAFDAVYVLDTGSTDGTIEKLRSRGAVVEQRLFVPWRFDHARNAALDMVPDDFDLVWSLDLDEIIQPGWREIVSTAWMRGVNRPRYQFIWNHKPDGSPDITYAADKCFLRHGYRWKGPVHEYLSSAVDEKQEFLPGVVINHYADNTKPRSSYLPLLELAVSEEPNNDRYAHYLGREYFNHGMLDKADLELKRHISLPSARWNAERAASMIIIADIAKARGDQASRTAWLLRASAEAPGEREPWVSLSQAYYDQQNHPGAYFAAKQALSIKVRPPSYICRDYAWNHTPCDLASVSAWYIGSKFEGLWHGMEAERLNPNDPRLKNNVKCMKEGMLDPYCTHQRMLPAVLGYFGGPVLELGVGHYSTHLLHGICAAMKRPLHSMDKDGDWLSQFASLATEGHTLQVTRDWNDVPDRQWGVVFVDGDIQSRAPLIKQLLPKATVLVVHDTEDTRYGFQDLLDTVPWIVTDKSRTPWTSAISLQAHPDFRF